MNSPVTDLTSNDLRSVLSFMNQRSKTYKDSSCNVGGESGTGTDTVNVTAGSAFSITADVAVYHQGPISFYMAAAGAGKTAADMDGSGTVWFKIEDIGPTFSGGVATWDLEQTYSSTFPAGLPDGEYLMRTQQLAIHNPYPGGIPQFYISCTQVSVSGGGAGTPGPLVAIPGAFSDTDPGYTVNIYSDFTNYTVPGPTVVSSYSVHWC